MIRHAKTNPEYRGVSYALQGRGAQRKQQAHLPEYRRASHQGESEFSSGEKVGKRQDEQQAGGVSSLSQSWDT